MPGAVKSAPAEVQVTMDFRLSSEEEEFRQEVRAFLQKEVTPELVDESRANRVIGVGPLTKEFLGKLGARRWLAPHFPKEYGGLGAGHSFRNIVFDELDYAGALPLTLVGVGVVGPTLLQYGSEQQKKDYLPRIARGEIEFALGYTEPNAGSDLANLSTKATDEGDHFVINGQKCFNTGCHFAQYVWLAARTNPGVSKHKGISLFIVDMKTPGITIRPLWVMDGERTNEVFYDNVVVPRQNLIGEKDRGFYYILTALTYERWFACGGLVRTFEEFVGLVKETGHNRDPLVRQTVASLATELEVIGLLSQRCAWMVEKGQAPWWEAPMVKICATEFIKRLGREGTSIFGLYGQLGEECDEAPLHGQLDYYYRHGARRTISAGTNEIQRNAIARMALGFVK